MTVCPCCGFKFAGDLQVEGCASCGSRAVGPPLSKPVTELPFYGRALFVGTVGSILLIVFLTSTVMALIERGVSSFGFWSVVSAAETAAWRLKWVVLPVAIVAFWGGSMISKTIRRDPDKFGGLRFARAGLTSSALVVVMIATFIGVTIPDRLRQHQRGLDAATYAQGYTIQGALLEYRARFKTLPATLDDLRMLPDPDGSLAAALAGIDSSAYSPGADIAALPNKKPRELRGAALRNASLASSDDGPEGGLSFTKYELRLPGQDKKLGTEDDWTILNGLITKPTEPEEESGAASVATRP